MPPLKTFLSDHETRVDLLNNQAIAATIVALVRDKPDRPITVGVHGDWGVGKSSILEMIEATLERDHPKVLCLKFNGWRFQGFEDAKIALIEGIVTGLIDKRSLMTKATDQVKAVLKRIDWLKVAKKTGGMAITAFTGLPSPDLVQSVVNGAVKVFTNPAGAKADVDGAIDSLQGLLKPDEASKQVSVEINEFRKEFDALLAKAEVDQLIVLIDDLDRCLPDTAIETLEAIRLFVFTPRTAFVVAADEAMIEYSVRKHFPDLPDSTGPQSYARNYLEKLIQVPFRIPAPGELETRIYVALVLAEATLGSGSKEFESLIVQARDVLRRPWLGLTLEDKAIREALGEKLDQTADLLTLSDRIGPTLARGTNGNPRQIKRFLNTILLRESIAIARGFGDDVNLSVLAKLLLAERFKAAFFDQLVLEAASNPKGFAPTLASLENTLPPTEDDKAADTPKVEAPQSGQYKDSPWSQDGWVASWTALDPKLSDIDLRPYVFVANQQARMGLGTALGQHLSVVTSLMGAKLAVVGMEPDLKKLAPTEAGLIFAALVSRIRQSDLRTEPAGVAGLRVLAKAHPSLQVELMAFLETLSSNELGLWVTTGWAEVLGSQGERFLALLTRWAEQTANTTLATAAKELAKQRPGSR